MTPAEKDRLRLALLAADFRSDMDALMKKHGAFLALGWEGKWAKLQIQFPKEHPTLGVTVMEVTRDKRVRYVLQAEELKGDPQV